MLRCVEIEQGASRGSGREGHEPYAGHEQQDERRRAEPQTFRGVAHDPAPAPAIAHEPSRHRETDELLRDEQAGEQAADRGGNRRADERDEGCERQTAGDDERQREAADRIDDADAQRAHRT